MKIKEIKSTQNRWDFSFNLFAQTVLGALFALPATLIAVLLSLSAGSASAQELFWAFRPFNALEEPKGFVIDVDDSSASPVRIRVPLPNEDDLPFVSKALDYSASTDRLFFTADTPGPDSVREYIVSTDTSGEGLSLIHKTLSSLTQTSLSTLAVADQAGFLFFMTERPNPENGLERPVLVRTDLDGSNLQELFFPGGTTEFKRIVVDETNAKIYFNSDLSPFDGIFRADFDGSNLERVLDQSRFTINDIALDPSRQVIYWSNADHFELKRAKVTGNLPIDDRDINPLFENVNKDPLHDLLIAPGDTLDKDTLFFADLDDGFIMESALDGTNQSAVTTIPKNDETPDFAVYRPDVLLDMTFKGTTSTGKGPGQDVIDAEAVHGFMGPLELFEETGGWFYAFDQKAFFYLLPSNNRSRVILYDALNGQWVYTDESAYPWHYYFGGGELPQDWYYFFEESAVRNGFRIWASANGNFFNDEQPR